VLRFRGVVDDVQPVRDDLGCRTLERGPSGRDLGQVGRSPTEGMQDRSSKFTPTFRRGCVGENCGGRQAARHVWTTRQLSQLEVAGTGCALRSSVMAMTSKRDPTSRSL
jgi:hypothetical protein